MWDYFPVSYDSIFYSNNEGSALRKKNEDYAIYKNMYSYDTGKWFHTTIFFQKKKDPFSKYDGVM